MRPAELTHWKTTCQAGGYFQLANCIFLPFTKYYPHQEAFKSSCLLSFSSFFSSSVFYYWVPPSWVRHPHHHRRHPIQAQAALKVLEKYWSCICVFPNFPRPLYPLTSRRSVDVEANKKPSQLGGWKNYTAFSSHSSRANWRGNVSIVPFHWPLFEGLPAMKWRWKWFVAIGKPQIIMLCGHLWYLRHFRIICI